MVKTIYQSDQYTKLIAYHNSKQVYESRFEPVTNGN